MPRVQILTVSTGSLWPHPKVLRSRLQVRFLNKKTKKQKRFRRSWRTLSRFSNKRTFRAERRLARRGPITVYEMSSVYPDAQCQNVVVNLKQRGVASVFVVLFVIRFALYVWQGPCLGLATFFAFHSNRHERPALPCKWDDITYRERPPHRLSKPKNGHHASNMLNRLHTRLFFFPPSNKKRFMARGDHSG